MTKLHVNDELFDVDQQEVTMVVTQPTLGHGRVRVLALKENTERVLLLEGIRQLIDAGQLKLHRPGAPSFSPAMQASTALEEALSKAQSVAREVCEYAERHNVSIRAAYEKVKEKHQKTAAEGVPCTFPSPATAYRYIAAERKGLPVLLGAKNKGNRTERHSDEVVELIVATAEQLFAIEGSRWSVRKVRDACNQAAHDRGLLKGKQPLSRKFVNKVIFENVTTDAEYDRMDPRTRAAQKAVAKNRIRINGVFQRVEQDALHLPWRVRTEAGDSKNIWLVHAIDCGTSMPVGWHLVIGAPNESSGLQCVESVLFSKKKRFAELGLDIPIDLYGTPQSILFDNGAEAKGDRMKRLTRLRIAISYCKSRHPHHKPHIERLNRSLKEALETLPGCTRLDGVDGMRDPEELNDLPMTLLELERWIVRWYYEVWANTALQRLVRSVFSDDRELGGTPSARLDALVSRDKYPLPLPPNRDEWRFAKYDHVERVLARTTGITYETFHFRGPNLERAIAKFAENSVTVLADPEDFRTVHVVDGDDLIELVNIDVDEHTPAYSFAQANEMSRAAQAAAGAPGAAAVANFKRDLFARSAETAPAQLRSKVGSSPEQAREVANRAKAQAAVKRAMKKPLPAKAGPGTGAGGLDIGELGDVGALAIVDRKTGAAV